MTEQLDTIKKTEMLEALEEKHGIVSEACRSIGLSRSTHYYWMENDPEYKKQVDEIIDVAIDYVEGKLFEKIAGIDVASGDKVYSVPPSDTAIIFYLKTKAKKRGYIEKTEQELTIPQGFTINYNRQKGNEPLPNDTNS